MAPHNGMSGLVLKSPFKDPPSTGKGDLGSCSGSRLHPQGVRMQLSLQGCGTLQAPSPEPPGCPVPEELCHISKPDKVSN